ncbi:glycosyltransferase family 2 protein [uncultured Cetobacterium sp.]|uniref:glycosyltransferase family 2 protein n=1 Tax=uncultured Cetobacterium sp. TaxID=527638 RepID=UPI0025D9161A|nr:glycosyltransferase family 2 protein [uncultured Cetobacterium sp.]
MKKDNNPLVSIIIPTYRRPHLIKKAIQNIKKQSYKNLEIIVINDNGVENEKLKNETYFEIENFIKENAIKYMELENNLGGALARNEGIKKAKGKYISFFDDDDEYYIDKIKLQVEKFEESKNKNIAFIKSEMDFISNGLVISTSNTKRIFEETSLLKSHLLNLHGIVGTISFLFKREILNEIGGFSNVSIRQEYMLILKILSKGYNGIHLDKNLVAVNCDGESIIRTKNERKVESMKDVLSKRLSYSILNENEKKKILKNHYLDLAEWYCGYKEMKCIKFSILGFQLQKDKIIFLIKINLKNIFGRYYLKVRKWLKGF